MADSPAKLKDVVYTALVGSYEALQEQPMARQSTVEFICFSDDPELTSNTWRIVQIPEATALDQVRTARRLKIHPPKEVTDFERSLWIDNRVILKVDPSTILDEWLASAEVAMPRHDHRGTVRDEFRQVLHVMLDDPRRVRSQLLQYEQYFRNALLQAPLWTALIARRRTAGVEAFEDAWWDQVAVYSRRDQLSVRVAERLAPVEINEQPLPNRESGLHIWRTEATLRKDPRVHTWQQRSSVRAIGILVRDSVMSVAMIRRLILRTERLFKGQYELRLPANGFTTRGGNPLDRRSKR